MGAKRGQAKENAAKKHSAPLIKKGTCEKKTPKIGEAPNKTWGKGAGGNDKKRKAKKESKQTFKTKGETDRRQNKPHAWQLRRIEVYLHPEKGALMVEW